MMRIGSAWMAVAAAALVLVTGTGMARATVPAVPSEGLCAAETARNERLYGIPNDLLDAISVVESGRYDRERRATLAWPWTVTSGGEGKYFPTKAEAVAEVKRLRAKGVKNIDVGCMQVNLMYHPDAFASVEDAFEPANNVGYAARFLKGLFSATNHWVTAASYYHSQTPSLAAAYRDRLMKVWNGSGEAGTAVAAAPSNRDRLALKGAPIERQPALRPAPSKPGVEEMRQDYRAAQLAAAQESRRIAEAYRQARLSEYQLRRVKMVDYRRSRGLALDGY